MLTVRILFLSVSICLSSFIKAENQFDSSSNNLVKAIEVFSDDTNELTSKDFPEFDFKKSDLDVPNFQADKVTYWFKFSIKSNNNDNDKLLVVDNPVLSDITLFTLKSNSVVDSIFLSNNKKFSSRKYFSQSFVFDVQLTEGENVFLLKVTSGNQVLLPLKIMAKDIFYEEQSTKDVVFGLYFGIILVMILYNLILFFSVKDSSYLYYVLYILFVGLTQAIFNGYAFKFLWPNNIWLSQHSLTIVGALSGISMAFFVIDFLKLKYKFKIITWIYYVTILVYGLAIVLNVFNEFHLSYRLTDACAGFITFFTFFVAIKVFLTGNRSAKFFLIAWVVFLVGVFVFVLRNFGVLPYNNFTNYTMPVGSALEVILLSLALADRINILKREKADAQKRELEVLQENQSLIENRNVELEKKVGERTKDLQKSNDELNDTLSKLQKAQVQLVESEKMVSLGQLTAGVAHEINNPINFVLSNVSPLRRDLDDLLAIINEYDNVKINPELGFSKVDNLKKSLDFDYLKEEINQILGGIENGAERTSEIVKSLRMFSRLDESEQKKARVTDCIESTLSVLTSKIKDFSVIVNKDYQFKEEINCFPGKLNQVFMNLINNSLDALEGVTAAEISFLVSKKDNWLEVIITDNGMGMSEEVKNHIFDPFFTTKEVGKGTGLGMSIVYSIIQDHNGKITLESEKGVGTTFKILLPITN